MTDSVFMEKTHTRVAKNWLLLLLLLFSVFCCGLSLDRGAEVANGPPLGGPLHADLGRADPVQAYQSRRVRHHRFKVSDSKHSARQPTVETPHLECALFGATRRVFLWLFLCGRRAQRRVLKSIKTVCLMRRMRMFYDGW